MSNYSERSPSPYISIPLEISRNKKLEPCAKLLYGELVGLCQKEGYAWASNKYLADIFEVDERTIQRWLDSLKRLKVIIVEIEKNGMNTLRRIFIPWLDPKNVYGSQRTSSLPIQNGSDTEENSKNVCDTAKMSPSIRQKCHPRYGKNVTLNNTLSNNKEDNNKPAAPVAVDFSALEKLNLDKASLNTIKRTFAKEGLKQEALDHALRWIKTATIKISLGSSILWAAREMPPIPDIIDPESNKQAARAFDEKYESTFCRMDLGNTAVEFISANGQICYLALSYESPGFKNILQEFAKEKGFKKRKE